jgi:hypothetical protein
MPIDYVGNGIPTLPVPPRGALYYDQVDGFLYASVPRLGQWFLIGGGGSGITAPVILTSEQFVNTTMVQAISIAAAATQMYAMSIYMNTPGEGGSGETVTATVSYTAADGSGDQTISLILPLDTANVVMETYPLLALGGTSISITTSYGGAYNPAYSIGASIVQMPVGA